MSDPDLTELRKQIDALDEELLQTLARRMDVVEVIGRYKKAHGLDLRDEARLKAMLEARIQSSEQLNLPSELVTKLYQLIHEYALKREKGA